MKIGDIVKIVNYGHKTIRKEEGEFITYDEKPELLGMEGQIIEIRMIEGKEPQYALRGIPEKMAWYLEEQLEFVSGE